MADCECLPRCPFFNEQMSDMPATVEMYKRKYCRGDNSQCGRYIVFQALGRERVPPDLYPHEHDRAQELLLA